MKKVLFLLICIACIGVQSIAQKHGKARIDSLLTVLQRSKSDTNRVVVLNWLSLEFYRNNPDTAIYFANEAKSLATKLNYPYGIVTSTLNLTSAMITLGNYQKAMENARSAVILLDKLLLSDKAAGKTRILKKKASAYNTMGSIYYFLGKYPEALKNYFAALKIREGFGDKESISDSYMNIGVIYAKQGNDPEALKHFFASLELCRQIGRKEFMRRNYINIGNIYDDQKNYAEALKNFLTALKIAEEFEDKTGIAVSNHLIGSLYLDQGNYTEALKYLSLSQKVFMETGNKDGIADSYLNMGTVYYKQKKYDQAYQMLIKGLSLSKEFNILENIKDSYFRLARVDSARGDFKTALEHYKMYISTRDSMFSKENTKKLVRSQMQYDFDKKEAGVKAEQDKKDALAKKELQVQKLVRNGFIIGFILVVIVAIIILRQRKKISKEKKISEELLLNILPSEVASELKLTGRCQPKTFSMVTVLFADFKDFTKVSERVSAELLVGEINFCFSAFDNILQKYKIEKIKTVGDSYMCASGLPTLSYSHAFDVVTAGLEMRDFILSRKKEKEGKGEIAFDMRIGIHTGPVVAGIVGVKKFQYDIWGDTVNLAARMEQSCDPGQVNISGSTNELVKDKFKCIHRGKIEAKNKGEVDMYFVEGTQ